MAENILAFQDGREAAMAGNIRDRRMADDWLAGYDMEADALNLPVWGDYSAKTDNSARG